LANRPLSDGPDEDFLQVLPVLLETLSHQAAESGYFLIAADLRAVKRRADVYLKSTQLKTEDRSSAKILDLKRAIGS
jgi:hypothetical protein